MDKILILYGSESGNSEYCAYDLEKDIKKLGLDVIVLAMDDYEYTRLSAEKFVIVITSTHGDGDAPYNAQKFMSYLKNSKPSLGSVNFGVCALGDRAYPNFAKAGRDFDKILESLGATRVTKRVDCDAYFDLDFSEFKKGVLAYFKTIL